jgi:hypothetical protein
MLNPPHLDLFTTSYATAPARKKEVLRQTQQAEVTQKEQAGCTRSQPALDEERSILTVDLRSRTAR